MYETLIDQIILARKRSARFFKADLHVHSYESSDFPRTGHKGGSATTISDADKSAQPRHFVNAAKGKGLHLIAVTDHNKSKVAEQIASLSDEDLTILPGMEVSLKTSFFTDYVVHVLAIFPEKYGNADIERVFADSGMPIYAERKHDSVLDMPVSNFINVIHSHGGICVASHVNSDKGIRHLFRESNTKRLRLELRKRELRKRRVEGALTAKESNELARLETELKETEDVIQNQYLFFLAEHEFDAVEVQRSADRQFYSGTHVDNLGIRPVTCVIGSDAHNLSDIGLTGHCTYIKMTQPSFVDLRKALRDPGTRVRFEDDVFNPPIARILGIQFDGGFFQQYTISFSDNLTCLIGGRGSGKSATIEAFRYIFSRPTSHLHKDKQSDIHARLSYTLNETDAKVVITDRSSDTYVLKRRYGEARTVCYEPDGTAHPEIEVASASNLQVEIYGWGEIEELARSKREQLSLVDGFIPELKETNKAIQDLSRTLKENTNRVIELAEEVKSLVPSAAELPAKKALLSRLSTEVLDTLFKDYDRNQQAQSAITSAHTLASEIQRVFLQADGNHHELETRLRALLRETLPALAGYEWREDFEISFLATAESIQQKYSGLIDDFEQLLRLIANITNRLTSEEATVEATLNRVAEEATDSDVKSMLSRRKTLTEEVSNLQIIQTQIDQKQQAIQELLDDRWKRIVPELQRARRLATRLRRVKLRQINTQLRSLTSTAKVSISLAHQKERESFKLALGTGARGDPEGILKKIGKHYISDRYAELYASRHSPHTFVRAVLNESDDHLWGLRACKVGEDSIKHEVITLERAAVVKKHLNPKMEESLYYEPDKLRKLLELEHSETEDLIQICLDDEPIEELSPGQRCSALIPIILLESTCPLIIDQPEDNLDNKLVFSLVVDIIRGLKEKRQIVVATHNPNIPVSGDAEQIVVFESHSREKCDRVVQGSVDCEDIVDQVKAIMEGSEEAFRIRAEKYGYRPQVK